MSTGREEKAMWTNSTALTADVAAYALRREGFVIFERIGRFPTVAEASRAFRDARLAERRD